MTEAEQSIYDCLVDLESKVAQMQTADPKPNLVPIFEQLDALARSLPPSTDGELLHFLHRKSYEKARLLLEGKRGEVKRGSCGH